MKSVIYKGFYRILSYLSKHFDNRYLTKYKVLLGTSLLMLTACQLIKKNDQNENFLYSGSKDDSQLVMCYDPVPPEEPEPVKEDPLIVEEIPEFPGGEEKMEEYIYKKIRYPKAALENGICGRVTLTVIVEEDGSLNEIEVVRGVDSDLDKEAIRIIKGMPKWKPGKQNGKDIRMKYVMQVNFRLPH